MLCIHGMCSQFFMHIFLHVSFILFMVVISEDVLQSVRPERDIDV